jgi:transcriptional regulator with XRE-family HTH domain
MQTLGARLRQERESRKLPLSQIAEETRISQRYLEAIEADDMSAMPGEFFFRAFVRQYATYLGVSQSEIERHMNLVSTSASDAAIAAETAPANAADRQISALRDTLRDAPIRPAQDDGFSKRWLLYAAGIMVGSLAYFAFNNYTAKSPDKSPETTSAVSTPETATIAQPPPVKVEPTPVTPTPVPAGPAPAEPAPTPPANPASDQFSLTITAKAMTWIRVTADGNKLYGGTIEAGQTRTFNAKDMELIVGNAGTLDVIYNGKPLQYGNMGEVKTLLVTPTGWKFKPKPPPTETPTTPATTPTTGL